MASDTVESFVLYVECKKGSEETTLTFFDAVPDIGLDWLRGAFLNAAEPVLGITEVTDAYYLKTYRTNVE